MGKKVAPNTWAEAQGIQIGDMLVEIADERVCELSKEEFLQAIKLRPLRMCFVVNPLKRGKTRSLSQIMDEEDECLSASDEENQPSPSSVQNDDCEVLAKRSVLPSFGIRQPEGASQDALDPTDSRISLSDWYGTDDAIETEGANVKAVSRHNRASVTDWYCDDEKRPDNSSVLTTYHRMSLSAETIAGNSELAD